MCALTSPALARAQALAPPRDKVAAEALFEEGRRLVGEGKLEDACPKFAESERLDPSPSTLLNLANCWEKVGRRATAWATYKEAESAASAAKRQDYMAAAQRHAEALATTLARLTISVAQPKDGLEVKRDGVFVGSAEWGVAIPIDAGRHTIEASAPGYKSWTAPVQVANDGVQAAVVVPALEALPPAAATAGPTPRSEPASTSVPSTEAVEQTSPEPRPGSAQRTVALVIGGAGVVGLGVSGVLALLANAKNHDSNTGCDADNVCRSATAFGQRSDARSLGDAATVAFGVGAAALVGGAVVWLTSPRAPPTAGRLTVAPTVGRGAGGVAVAGTW
jgi:hypothetical protein